MRDNIGEEVDAEQLIQEACRSCLEQVRPKGTRVVGTGFSPPSPGKKCDPIISGILEDAQQATYIQIVLGAVVDRREGK